MPAPYQITSIRKRPDIDAFGRFIEVYEINFVTGKGAASSVKIPAAQFTPDNARKIVAEEAAKLDSLLP
ncbi:MAG: hypothetical protein H5U03_00165 [Clostridia bacterium]|nr:hypothetical protein [Clostridia bacterium]